MAEAESLSVKSKEIWDTLSKIDVSDYTDDKIIQNRKFTYLSWAWAWGVLMKHYPGSTYTILPEEVYENSEVSSKVDGRWVTNKGTTVMVGVEMDIKGVIRRMWLPVMDAKNNAQVNPCARSISDARMRCLVKLLALYGLGHYIYAGEDVPEGDSESASKAGSKSDSPSPLAPAAVEAARVTYETMSVFADEAKDSVSLEKFWRDNKAPLERLKNVDPESFGKLIGKFKEVKERLKGK